MHALADTIEAGLDKRGAKPSAGVSDENQMWNEYARFCAGRSSRLTTRELEFVEQMVLWTNLDRDLSDKQARWLDLLYRRLRREDPTAS
jgi:hypothetical protein